jgi:protein TonB
MFSSGAETQGAGPTRTLFFAGIVIAALVTIGVVAIWKINPWSDAAPATSTDKPSSTAAGLATNTSVAPAPGGFVPVPAPQPPPSSTGSANPDPPKVDSTVKPDDPPQAPADEPPTDREDREQVRLGPGIAKTAIKKSQPSYPPMAKSAGIEGDVVVEIFVNEAGNVVRARAVSGHPLLRDTSVRAAREWTFKPTVRNGEPVKAIGTLTFYFRQGVSLRRDESKMHRGSSG